MRNVSEDVGKALAVATRIADALEGIDETLKFISNELEESNLNSSPVYPEILQVELTDSAAHEIRQLVRSIDVLSKNTLLAG